MKKIGIVGCGAIGSYIAVRIEKDLKERARLCALCDSDIPKARELASKFSRKIPVLSLDELVKRCDIIVEAASGKVSYGICKNALSHSKDIMVMSIGGILEKAEELFELARRKKCRIILPSGALCGIDGIKSAGAAGIKKVTLTTRKPPRGLEGAPFIVKNNIDLAKIDNETVIFEGNAFDAVSAFPANINVSALLSIAGIGAGKTVVRIVTSPDYRVNSHEVEAEGDFGKLVARTENVPTPENPKTSFLASLSAVATLKQVLDENARIGT